jgi:hypothetical protein
VCRPGRGRGAQPRTTWRGRRSCWPARPPGIDEGASRAQIYGWAWLRIDPVTRQELREERIGSLRAVLVHQLGPLRGEGRKPSHEVPPRAPVSGDDRNRTGVDGFAVRLRTPLCTYLSGFRRPQVLSGAPKKRSGGESLGRVVGWGRMVAPVLCSAGSPGDDRVNGPCVVLKLSSRARPVESDVGRGLGAFTDVHRLCWKLD